MKYLADVVTLQLDPDLCTGCGMCTVVCPHAVFSLENGKAHIGDRDMCMECGACSLNCPDGAIFVQAGVGCAQAVINTTLGRKGSCSCTIDDYPQAAADYGTSDDQCEDRTGHDGCTQKPNSNGPVGCC